MSRFEGYLTPPSFPGGSRDVDDLEGAGGQSFEVALDERGKRRMRQLLKESGADQNFRSTLRTVAGRDFTPAELEALEERVLDRVNWLEAGFLPGIEAGDPVVVSPRQKATIDGLIGKLGGDPLAARAKAAYGKAVRRGRVRVR